jgi:uroporphyrinogen-III synthase
MDPVPLLLTRATEELPGLLETLGRGRQVLAAPCIAFEDLPLPDISALRDQPLQLLLSSPRVVPAVIQLNPPVHWRILALAPRTSEALRQVGIRVDQAVVGGGAALAAEAGEGPLLLLTSDLGGAEVRGVRPDVQVWPVYRTVCPAALPDAALQAMEGDFDLLFASPSAVENFVRLAPGRLKKARHCYAHGGSTEAALRRHQRTAVSVDLARPSALAGG